ncbi:putative nucleotidyltransferase substrate binding domain-containing protein [Rhodococcoides kyotonense]|uniref:CBS domain-containing protein n=1 Tax=Rhodococcoides kyotonense TaxID=398843 RepID=A0A239D3M8_9NOCA|nr:putative nucleotidyltransferase substrate binding domain-containing protein [Rhodococcus kyotonensis]SNS27015.1 CBS domain-containing protein [Rhodococcus kyotonensis]
MDDTAEFLRRFPPFHTATQGELEQLADMAEVVEYRSGATILDVDMRDVDSVWVVRSGRVVILHPDDATGTSVPIDTIDVGGVFGFSAMLSGASFGFVARTTEPSVVVQLPGKLMRSVFSKPAGLAFLADAVSSATARLGGPTASTRRSVVVRRSIADASTTIELADASRRIPDLVVDLFRGGNDAIAVSAILSVVVDAVVRRALELAWSSDPDVPRADIAWLSLGSVARREAMPSSDVDSALSWSDALPDPASDRTRDSVLMDMARKVHATLAECGLPADSNGAVASSPRFARSASQWRSAAEHWLDDPFGDRGPVGDSGLIMSSLLVDGRVVWGNRDLHTVPEAYRRLAEEHPDALRLQLRDAIARRARVRSLRDVLARRGRTFDLKAHAITPIVNLARWGGLSVGVASASTPARLAAASGNGILTDRDVHALTEVFELVQKLRLGHQVEQIASGARPGDVVVMADLSALERSLLSDGVREVAAVQRRVAYLAGNVGVRS